MDRQLSQKVSKNKKVIYTYDELNRLKTVTIDWLNPKPVATYYYDDAGRVTSLTNFNGTVTTYGYDNANRLTALENKKSDTTTILASYSFTLDGNGNRTQIVQNEPLTLTLTTDTVNYGYNAKKNRLMTANAMSFWYDNEGQLGWSTSDSASYAFDEAHRLINISGSYYYEFFYDAVGNRLTTGRDWSYTNYVYDAGGNLLAEADASNNITKYYIHGLGLMAMVTDTGEAYTYHFNAVGSTVAMTDNSQTIVNKYSYDPFGNILSEQETVPQIFKFVGQYGVMTEPNGFYYMRARYYDPAVGRFISEDPSGFEGGDVNLMVYVGNQPVNRIDPSGLFGPFGPGLKNIRPTPNPEPPRPDAVSGAAFRVDPNIEQMLSPQRKAIPGELTTIMASELFDVGRQAYTDIANFARWRAYGTLLPIILIPKEFLGPRELQAAPFKP